MKIDVKAILKLGLTWCVVIAQGCTDPVLPEFDFEEGLIYIDSFISTAPGASFAIVNQTSSANNRYTNEFVGNARVSFINQGTGEEVLLAQVEATYLPPLDFAASAGERWVLSVVLEDGRQYRSSEETVSAPVPIKSVEATYSPELFFRESLERFVPGHSISVNFDDPPGEENHYLWGYRSFEKLTICKTCFEGIFREGECQPFYIAPPRRYYSYQCSSDCWRIRYNEKIEIFSDAFSDGRAVQQLQVAEVPLYLKQNKLVQLQQHAVSALAYEYYKTLKDIVDNNGNFNAPPPAALLGNLYNPDNSNEYVLGRFTAASCSTANIFISVAGIQEDAIDVPLPINLETSPPIPVLDLKTFAPCEETRFSTGVEPEGWVD